MQDPIEKIFLPDFLLPTPGMGGKRKAKPQPEDGMTQDVFAALCLSAAPPILW